MLPAPLRESIEAALGDQIKDAANVGGGCISHATRIETNSGTRAFLKWGAPSEFAAGIFAAEADALAALGNAGAVRVPEVITVKDEAGSYGWLLLEWLDPGNMSRASWRALGNALAKLHQHRSDRFGWPAANFIGSLPQSNDWHHDWPSFWREQRILPQLERANLLAAKERSSIEALLEHVAEIAGSGNQEGASLLHGDLWGGNVHGLADGSAALIDPSIYFGHREVDLAMASLFGGFDAGFFEAYEDAWPLLEGWEGRRKLYQLYYLLVHVNLFGRSYVPRTMSVVASLGF